MRTTVHGDTGVPSRTAHIVIAVNKSILIHSCWITNGISSTSVRGNVCYRCSCSVLYSSWTDRSACRWQVTRCFGWICTEGVQPVNDEKGASAATHILCSSHHRAYRTALHVVPSDLKSLVLQSLVLQSGCERL